MDDETLVKNLILSIKKDLTLSREMVQLLKIERSALEEKNLENIYKIIEGKSRLILAIDANQKQRDDIQEKLGFDIGFIGLKELIKSIDSKYKKPLNTIANELTTVLQDIEHLNLINGKIVNISHSQTNRILNIMLGHTETLYDNRAGSISTHTSNSITKA